MAISRRDLFGYAGASHQPQGRVLTAEEEYGAHGYGALNSPDLAAEEAYGALNSPSLFAEEEYGADDDDFGFDGDDTFGLDDDDDSDDDEFGALNSASLFAEEEYGEDDYDDDFGYAPDDEYGDDDDYDDDSDDEFGADDDPELDELDELNEEIDKEIFGSWYGAGTLAAPAGAEEAVAILADALNVGAFLPAFAQSSGAEPGWFEYFLEKSQKFMEPSDSAEIATYLLVQPGFDNWDRLSDPQRAQLVRAAVTASAIPGLEYNWDEPFRQSFQQNPGIMGAAWSGLKSAPSAIWGLITQDTVNTTFAALQEIPGFGHAFQMLANQAGAQRPDQLFNGLAIRYYLLGLIYPNIYLWLAQSVTKQGQQAIQIASSASARQQPQVQDVSPLPPMLPPPQVIESSSTGLPSPPVILAVGFGLGAAGAVLGVFK